MWECKSCSLLCPGTRHARPGTRHMSGLATPCTRHEYVRTCVAIYLARSCTGHNVYAVAYMRTPQGNVYATAFNLLDWHWPSVVSSRIASTADRKLQIALIWGLFLMCCSYLRQNHSHSTRWKNSYHYQKQWSKVTDSRVSGQNQGKTIKICPKMTMIPTIKTSL